MIKYLQIDKVRATIIEISSFSAIVSRRKNFRKNPKIKSNKNVLDQYKQIMSCHTSYQCGQ